MGLNHRLSAYQYYDRFLWAITCRHKLGCHPPRLFSPLVTPWVKSCRKLSLHDRSGDRTQHFELERLVNYPFIRCDHIGLGGLLPSEDSNPISLVSKGVPHGTNQVTYHTMPSTGREVRTPDFLHVRQTLSQLSYTGIR